MIDVWVLFVVASALHISSNINCFKDATAVETEATLEEIIESAIRANNETVTLSGEAARIKSLLRQSNYFLNQVVAMDNTHKRLNTLRLALSIESGVLTTILMGSHCKKERKACRDTKRNVEQATIAISEAIRKSCGSDEVRRRIDDVFQKALRGPKHELQAFRIAKEVVPLSVQCQISDVSSMRGTVSTTEQQVPDTEPQEQPTEELVVNVTRTNNETMAQIDDQALRNVLLMANGKLSQLPPKDNMSQRRQVLKDALDAAQERQVPTLEELIVNATRVNNESMTLLNGAPSVENLLAHANQLLNGVLDEKTHECEHFI
ncbi:unnamed protein product [Nippostrongylus brasiliensis]|uniref:Secreted protein n=1 Tax=Nippostrongylus brasiliensis TaxID=27835 RepID=A0A0N4Y8R4_NIPBR|nr:unnamed protein product [Nippostrongylus brasiliensis]